MHGAVLRDFRADLSAAPSNLAVFELARDLLYVQYGQSRPQHRLLNPPPRILICGRFCRPTTSQGAAMSKLILTASERAREPIQLLAATVLGTVLLAALAVASAVASL